MNYSMIRSRESEIEHYIELFQTSENKNNSGHLKKLKIK